MSHPDLSKPHVAKRAAIALANAIGASCRIEQLPDGSKRVILGRRVINCSTWFAAYIVVYAIRRDSVLGAR
jgi:hypothetical protein